MTAFWRVLPALALPLLGSIGLWISASAPAAAQSRPLAEGSNLQNPFNETLNSDRVPTPNDYAVLYVHPTTGSDQPTRGSENQPLRTITYALSQAEANTIIVLADGTYSPDSGEQFPLQLQPGVTVQGYPNTRAPRAIIHGGGEFTSSTLAQQHAAVVAVDGSGLAHVVVANPDGQGVWIEAGSPVLVQNVFTGSGHAGVFIAGDGQPHLVRNSFYRNAVAGLVVYGPSNATVQSNLFEQTGVGITVSDAARPRILSNRIVGNREGVVLLAGAEPILQGNDISQNRRNSVVDHGESQSINLLLLRAASAQADPVPEPAQTAAPAVNPASEIPRETGIAAEAEPAQATLPGPARPLAEAEPEPAAKAPTVLAIARGPDEDRADIAVTSPAAAPKPEPAPTTEEVGPDVDALLSRLNVRRSPRSTAGERSPEVPSETTSETPSEAPDAVEIAVIPPPQAAAPSAPPTAPSSALPDVPDSGAAPANTDILQVPSNAPIGSAGSMGNVVVPADLASAAGAPPPPPSRAAALGLFYRVLVEAPDDASQSQVRSLVADAFRTRHQGQVMMQTGAYADEATANAMAEMMRRHGFEVYVVDARQ